MKLLTFLSILFGNGRIVVNTVDYCSLNTDHLEIDQKIEMGIGCSTVNGRRVYSQAKLKWFYNNGEPYNTKERLAYEISKEEKIK